MDRRRSTKKGLEATSVIKLVDEVELRQGAFFGVSCNR